MIGKLFDILNGDDFEVISDQFPAHCDKSRSLHVFIIIIRFLAEDWVSGPSHERPVHGLIRPILRADALLVGRT